MNKALLGLGIIGLLGVGFVLTRGHPKEMPSGSAIQGIPQIVTIGAGASKKESIPKEETVYNVKVEAPTFSKGKIGDVGKQHKPSSSGGGMVYHEEAGYMPSWWKPTGTEIMTSTGGVTMIPTEIKTKKETKPQEPLFKPEFEPIFTQPTFTPNVVWTSAGGVSTAFPW